jgi:hypothetical protein
MFFQICDKHLAKIIFWIRNQTILDLIHIKVMWLVSWLLLFIYYWILYKTYSIIYICVWVSTHTFKKESLKITSIEEEQTTQLPKEKSTKEQSTIYKSYTYNWISSNTNPTKNREWTHVPLFVNLAVVSLLD